jgi:5-methylcytosine-specific restriction endonuclease McrA
LPRQKDLPCADCGGLMWGNMQGKGSLPPGQATCRPCRTKRAAWPRHKRNSAGTVVQRSCGGCGAAIDWLVKPKGPPPKLCGTCRVERLRTARRSHRRRREMRRRNGHEPYTMQEIAARDKRRCGICGGRVAMTKAVPNPKAPTIDHLIPLSEGGPDSKANVQLAHFLCNSLRGTGGVVQLALVG